MPIDTYPSPSFSTAKAVLGFAPSVTTQSAIGAETDVAGCAVTVSVPAGRTIRVTGRIEVGSPSVNLNAFLLIKEGATEVGRSAAVVNTSTETTLTAETILTPTAGVHTYKLTLQTNTGTINTTNLAGAPNYILVEDITGGTGGSGPIQLGYAEVKADQLSLGTTLTDLTSLTVTVAVPAGRRIRVKGYAPVFYSPSAASVIEFAIYEGATQIVLSSQSVFAGGTDFHIETEATISPSAGTHTYNLKARIRSGTVNLGAGATSPAFILVEDITGTPMSVENLAWIDWVPTIGQGATANIAKTVTYSRYTRIGRTITYEFYLTITGTGTAASGVHLSVPVAGLAATNGMPIGGGGFVYDSSANLWYMGMPVFFTPDIYFLPLGSIGVGSQNLGIGNPIGTATMGAALAANDIVAGSVTYEAAA